MPDMNNNPQMTFDHRQLQLLYSGLSYMYQTNPENAARTEEVFQLLESMRVELSRGINTEKENEAFKSVLGLDNVLTRNPDGTVSYDREAVTKRIMELKKNRNPPFDNPPDSE